MAVPLIVSSLVGMILAAMGVAIRLEDNDTRKARLTPPRRRHAADVLSSGAVRDLRDIERFDAMRAALGHAACPASPPTRRQRRETRRLRSRLRRLTKHSERERY
jgi:hypothetical protein